MAKQDRKRRGRGSITSIPDVSPTHPYVPEVAQVDANRPVTGGAGKHRGDRRDMNKTYTGNQRHSARGKTPRPDVSTRAR